MAKRIEIVEQPGSKLSPEEPMGLVTIRGSTRHLDAEHSLTVTDEDRFSSGKRFDDIRALQHRATA